MKELLTMKEMADILGVKPVTLRRWVATKKITHVVTPGGHFRFQPELVKSEVAELQPLMKFTQVLRELDIPRSELERLERDGHVDFIYTVGNHRRLKRSQVESLKGKLPEIWAKRKTRKPTYHTCVSLTDDVKEKLMELAKSNKTSVANTISMIFFDWLNEKTPPATYKKRSKNPNRHSRTIHLYKHDHKSIRTEANKLGIPFSRFLEHLIKRYGEFESPTLYLKCGQIIKA